MNSIVVYFSKTGNTKRIAEVISKELNAKLFPLNIIKKGRRTKEEINFEKELVKKALEEIKKADIVFIGTPTEFRKPHARVMDFIDQLEAKRAAIFCTYYGMLGATFYDLEARFLQKNIPLVGKLNVKVGTEKYKFNLNVNNYKEKILPEHLNAAKKIASEAVSNKTPFSVRLIGVCGKNCQECKKFNKECKGAGFSCWSGSNCEIFNCCVIKKSLSSCDDCSSKDTCSKIKDKKYCELCR